LRRKVHRHQSLNNNKQWRSQNPDERPIKERIVTPFTEGHCAPQRNGGGADGEPANERNQGRWGKEGGTPLGTGGEEFKGDRSGGGDGIRSSKNEGENLWGSFPQKEVGERRPRDNPINWEKKITDSTENGKKANVGP